VAEGTPAAEDVTETLRVLDERIDKLREEGRAMEENVLSASKLRDVFADSTARDAIDSTKQKTLEAQAAYEKFIDTLLQYENASKALAQMKPNDPGYANQQALVNSLRESLSLAQQIVKAYADEGYGAEKVAQAERSRTKVEKDITAEITRQNGEAQKQSKIYEDISRTIVMTFTHAAMKALKDFWQEAISFATTYYDKLNEIRIVTMMTAEQADKLGKNYMSMAKSMSVRTTDIMDAAVEFWRQGLSEQEVEARLKATSMFAKISGEEFQHSAELITAATNSMNLDVNRVVDVFTYLGDASAAGADEVGVAMQKVAGTAGAVGVEFEWLGAMIAGVSEKTREGAEIIGTSFNAILARLNQVKKTGYNDEDTTNVNDIAKALKTANIELMNSEGQWNSFQSILMELAPKWDNLDAKTKGYIATTMAGTRQLSRFHTLMSDLAQMVDGNSRVMQLYEGALDSAGVASEKFAIWTDSVAAAQNRLKTAQEGLIDELLNGDQIKGFYDVAAELINNITAGTEATGGWIIKITALVAVVKVAATAFQVLGTAGG
jgi:TP901 family phage tail tape measure protein